jgi:4-amino-4-deoxy-L-arabinose transferase-like glycosyltransferase
MRFNLKKHFGVVPPQVWLALVVLAVLIPFLNKAIHIDDTLFVRAAQQIQKNPWDFYGFRMNWFGMTRPMIDNFDNPPLACYYLALAGSVAGWSEPVLHFAFILPAVMAVLGIFSLARRHCSQPAVAAAIALFTPVFLISASTLMCDVLALALWVWALVFFERGLENDHRLSFLASGLLAGMAVLAKLIGIGLLPLIAVYGFQCRRRAGWWLLTLAIPLFMAAGLEWATYAFYGKGLFLTAAGVSTKTRSHNSGSFFERILVGLSFAGGCFLPLLLFLPYLWSARKIAIGLCVAFPCLLAFPYLGKYSLLWDPNGSANWLLFAQSILFMIAGLHVLALAASDFWQNRSHFSLLLLLWVAGIFAFAAGLNWTSNGRSFLPMLPAVAILVTRRLEEQSKQAARFKRWSLWPLLPACGLSILLITADVGLASTGRMAAREISAKYLRPGNTLWFEGHWGFQYYMELEGAKPLERDFSLPRKGDVVVVPSEAVNTFDLSIDLVRPLEVFEFLPSSSLSTMSLSAGAGFYAATAGPFPFSVGRVDPERYYVLEVIQTLEQASKARGGISHTGAIAMQFEMERTALECESVIHRDPGNEAAHLQLAAFLASREKILQAENEFSKVLAINPNNGEAHLEMATLLARLNKKSEAMSHYSAAVRLLPQSSRARKGLDAVLAQEKKSPAPDLKASVSGIK